MRKERKHYTAEEKVAILRRHLLDKVPVSDLCAEVLDLLAMGFGDAEIGETMGLATRTVASERHPHPEGSQSRVREAAMKVS